MNYECFLREEWLAAYKDWLHVRGMIAFDSEVKRLAYAREFHQGGEWTSLGANDPTDVQVFQRSDGRRELWVKPHDKQKEKSPYARYWRQFVALCQVDITNGPPDYPTAVDHLFPETAAARAGIEWVRLMAVKARSNGVPAGIEKKLAKTITPDDARSHNASPVTILKITGFEASLSTFENGHAFADSFIKHIADLGLKAFELANVERELIAARFNSSHSGVGYFLSIVMYDDGPRVINRAKNPWSTELLDD